ncbi:MAG: hypothetical protein AAB368_15465, partial [bacterium]
MSDKSLSLFPANPGPGSDVRYQVVVTNTGAATITSLTVTDTVPNWIPAWTISTAQPAGIMSATRYDAGSGTLFVWSSGAVNLTPGMGFTFTIYGSVSMVCPGATVDNLATATAAGACGAGSSVVSNQVSFGIAPVPAIGFTVAKTQAPASPAPGDQVTYRIVVANTGAGTLSDVVVTDTISPVVVSATTSAPAVFGVPLVAQAASGTLFTWAGPVSWTTKNPMTTARYYAAAGVVDDRIYVIGGTNGASLGTNQEYNPATNLWTAKTPTSVARYGLVTGVVNGRIYAIGGYNGVTYFTTTEEYAPMTNAWTAKTGMPTARYGHAVGVVNGRIYAIGGTNGGPLNVNQEYDPTTDTWATKTVMPTGRQAVATGVVNGRIYVLG